MRLKSTFGRIMYRLMSLMAAMAMFAAINVGSAEAGTDEGETKMTETKHYFVQLLGTREGWPENMTPEEEKIMGEHYYYLKGLVKQRMVYMAGPVFDPVFGLIVLAVESEEEAREIMDKEPSVLAGVHTYELHPMRASLLVDYQSPERYVNDPSDKIIRKQVSVPVTLDKVWKAWTTTEGVKTFFSSAASVELRIGGPFEIYFITDAPDGSRGSEDCRILSYLPKRMLAFEWNAPPSFGALRDIRTQVILEFDPVDSGSTAVTLSHVGWGKGEEWDKLYEYFDNAWSHVLANFKRRCENGPLDWSE